MGITGMDHLAVLADDIEQTVDFYRGLGLEVDYVPSSSGTGSLPSIRLNEREYITVQQRKSNSGGASGIVAGADPASTHFCLLWDGSVQEVLDLLARHGIAVESGPSTRQGALGVGTSIYFRDPAGTSLEIKVYS